jgi:threonine aldolase
MTQKLIDLRSDTLSMPTDEMMQAIQTAPLGDDSRDGDPTVLELEALSAEMLGKEAGLLTVSGTMSNVVAMRTHAEPGATAIVEQRAHLFGAEFSGVAAVCGLLVFPVPGVLGAIDLDGLKYAVNKAGAGFPARALLCLENTHNGAGGTVILPEHTDRCAEIAHAAGLPVHLDGARVFNAAVKLGIDVRELTRSVDSVALCLSKGLSAPVGSVLVGSKPFIDRARAIRRALGGTMRQAGIIAAPGLIALRTMVDRLAEDHANARYLGEQLATIEGLGVNLDSVQTNMVYVDVSPLGIDAATFGKHITARGVSGLLATPTGVRFVTYRNVSREDVERAAVIIRETVAARPWAA